MPTQATGVIIPTLFIDATLQTLWSETEEAAHAVRKMLGKVQDITSDLTVGPNSSTADFSGPNLFFFELYLSGFDFGNCIYPVSQRSRPLISSVLTTVHAECHAKPPALNNLGQFDGCDRETR